MRTQAVSRPVDIGRTTGYFKQRQRAEEDEEEEKRR